MTRVDITVCTENSIQGSRMIESVRLARIPPGDHHEVKPAELERVKGAHGRRPACDQLPSH